MAYQAALEGNVAGRQERMGMGSGDVRAWRIVHAALYFLEVSVDG